MIDRARHEVSIWVRAVQRYSRRPRRRFDSLHGPWQVLFPWALSGPGLMMGGALYVADTPGDVVTWLAGVGSVLGGAVLFATFALYAGRPPTIADDDDRPSSGRRG